MTHSQPRERLALIPFFVDELCNLNQEHAMRYHLFKVEAWRAGKWCRVASGLSAVLAAFASSLHEKKFGEVTRAVRDDGVIFE